MKKIFTAACASLLLMSAFLIFSNKPIKTVQYVGASQEEGAESFDAVKRLEWERCRLADPLTGRIPTGIRGMELAYAATLPKYQSLSAPGFRSANAFVSRGPVNVGGRTRALAVDVTNDNILFAGSVNGGLWRSADGGQQWTRVSSVQSNQSITWIAQDQRAGHTNTWYYTTGEGYGASHSGAGAYYLGNGVFKSTDGGLTWASLPATATNTPQVFDAPYDIGWKIVTDPHDTVNDVLYLACYGIIYRSTNGGATWALDKGSTSTYSYFTDVDITGTGVVYGTFSSDGGQKGIWRKDPATNTWTDITPPAWDTASYDRVVIGVNPSNEAEAYFLAVTFGLGKMSTDFKGDTEYAALWKYTYLSGNGSGAGGQWNDLSANLPYDGSQFGNFNTQGGYDLILRVHPTQSNIVFIGGTNLYRSTDGFTSTANTRLIGGYDPLSTLPFYGVYPNHHSDQHNMVFLNNSPNVMIQSNDGGLVRTTDCTADPVLWQDINRTYVTSQFYTIALDHGSNNDIIIGGLQDYGTWFTHTSNVSDDWTHPGLGDGAFCAIDDNHYNYYMSRQEGKVARVQLDTNGNVTGFRRIDPQGGSGYMFISPFILDPNNPDIMYLAAGNKIWRNDSLTHIPLTGQWDSIPDGWSMLPDTLPVNGSLVSALTACKTPANRVYAGTSTRTILRMDNANTSTPVTTDITNILVPTSSNVSCIAVDPYDGDRIMVSYSNYSVYSIFLSEDGGLTWTKCAGNLESNNNGSGSGPSVRWVSMIPTGNGYVYLAATSTGLYGTNSLNGLNTVWTQLEPNTIGTSIVDMMDYRESDGLVAVATHGAGVFSAHLTDTLFTGLTLPANSQTTFTAFPVPAYDRIQVRFSTPPETGSLIEIYSMSGVKVRSIPAISAGGKSNTCEIPVDDLTAGTYFLVLRHQGQQQVKKIAVAH